MITNISLKNFKCFKDEISLPLNRINILYGKNGRGKSTLSQALLLLSQTMQDRNDISSLIIQGNLIKLGGCKELLNIYSREEQFYINLKNDSPKELLEMAFGLVEGKYQIAALNRLKLDGAERVNEMGSNESDDDGNKVVQLGATSDISVLQNLKQLQYVSADREGPHNSVVRNDSITDDTIGTCGEYVINVLERKGAEFQEQVSDKLSYVLDGAALKASPKGDEYIELRLNSVNSKETFKPENVGFGYSYVLPVIVAALLAKNDSILIVENPEAHLHTGAQSRLTEFLIETALEKRLQLIMETHSDHVVNGLRIMAKKEKLSPSAAYIHYFKHDKDQSQSYVETIHCDKNGNLDNYPDDFLDEWTKQMLELV